MLNKVSITYILRINEKQIELSIGKTNECLNIKF